MKIKSIEFKNFGSYGNKIQTIDFKNESSLILLVGQNGSGKSTISDVIKFGLYGKLPNKNLKDIPNRFNKNAYCKIKLESSGFNVIIERGLEPSIFKLYINGIEYDQSGKKNVQEYLENEILKIPYHIFNNIISISINDFKSFLNLNSYNKSLIVDKIFGMDVINQMNAHVKDELKAIKGELKSLDITIDNLNSIINDSNIELNNLMEKIKESNLNIENEIKEQISNFLKECELLKENINNLKNEKVNLIKEKTNIEKSIKESELFLKRFKEKENLYKNKKCPVCESDLTTDFHKDYFNELSKKRDDTLSELNDLNKKYKDLNKKIDDLELSYEKFSIEKSKIDHQIDSLKLNLESINEKHTFDNQKQSIENLINKKKTELDDAMCNKNKKEKIYNFMSIVENIFSSDGVKRVILNKILPLLNSEINYNLKKLSIDRYKVIINDNFDVVLSEFGVDVSFTTLSTGERKRIDFAIVLALIKVMKIKFNNLNILFLDEIFSSIDYDGILDILKILNEYKKELNLNIFLINHSYLQDEYFDLKINVIKQNKFSNLFIEKLN